MPETRLADLLRADAAAEAARDALRVVTSSALALVDTADDVARSAGRDLARRLSLPTRADVARLGQAVEALQTALAALPPSPPSDPRP